MKNRQENGRKTKSQKCPQIKDRYLPMMWKFCHKSTINQAEPSKGNIHFFPSTQQGASYYNIGVVQVQPSPPEEQPGATLAEKCPCIEYNLLEIFVTNSPICPF